MAKPFVLFIESEAPKSFKTKIWEVVTLDKSGLLGQVKWFASWRRYAFYPSNNTLFDANCLSDIHAFVAKASEEHGS